MEDNWRIPWLADLAYSWFSDGAPMAASPTLRPIPGGRQVPEEEGEGWCSKGESLVAHCYDVYVQFMNWLRIALGSAHERLSNQIIEHSGDT